MRRRLLASGLTASMLVACNAILGLDGDTVIGGGPDGAPVVEPPDGTTDATIADGNVPADVVVPVGDAGPDVTVEVDSSVGDDDDDGGDPLGVHLVVGVVGGAGYAEGLGLDARFTSLQGLVRDTEGNRYVIDGLPRAIDPTLGTVIRKISATGEVSTLAGAYGVNGYVDDVGTKARFTGINGITYDGQHTLYVTESTCHVRSIDTRNGTVATFAGFPGCVASTATGKRLDAAAFKNPTGIVVGRDFVATGIFGDAIYIADPPFLLMYRSSNDIVIQVCGGNGTPGAGDCTTHPLGGTDLVWDDTRLYFRLAQHLFRFVPSSTTIDQLTGNAAETVPPTLQSVTIAGAGLALESPGLAPTFFLGNGTQLQYAEEASGLYQRKAGGTDALWLDGPPDTARFERISGLARSGALTYDIADLTTLRSYSSAMVSTTAGRGRVAGNADTDTDAGVEARINTVVTPTFGPKKGLVYFFDRPRASVRSYDLVTHEVKMVAGGKLGGLGDKATLPPNGDGLVFDGTNLIFSSTFLPKFGAIGLRAIDPESKAISSITDEVSFGKAMASDGNGTVYSAGADLLAISSWTIGDPTTLVPVVGQAELDASTGGGNKPIFGRIGGMCFDAQSAALVVLDDMRHVIDRVDLKQTGTPVTKIAGTVNVAGYHDGLGIEALFGPLDQVTCDGAGFAYLADEQAGTIRRVNVQTGETHEVAGTLNRTGVLTGPLPGSLNTPTGLLALPNHHILAGSTNEAVLLDIHVHDP